jgi:hypothetical protein
MYLLYVDESGDTGARGSGHLILTAAALFEGKWRHIRDDLERTLVQHFPDPEHRPRELHAAEARKGRGEYARLSDVQRREFLADAGHVLTALRANEVCLFSVIVEKDWWFAQNPGRTGDDLYIEMFEDLVSRFDFYLKRRHRQGHPSKGLIVADPRHEAFCRALRRAVTRFHLVGTRWATLENVIETVLFLQSHESPGIQLADLASYALWRLVAASDTALAAQLRYCFDREPHTSRDHPGKWHGVKFHGPRSSEARSRIESLWPGV